MLGEHLGGCGGCAAVDRLSWGEVDAVNIGSWVKREGTFRLREDGTWTGPRWHLVESVVAEDAVTRCGKRMDRVTRSGGELQVSEVMPLTRMISQPQLCKAGCDRGAP